jgi:hypothetical protein
MRQVLYWSEDDLVGSPAQAIKLEGCAHDLDAECEVGRGGWFAGDEVDCSVQKTPFPYAVTAGKFDFKPNPDYQVEILITPGVLRHNALYRLVETTIAPSMHRTRAFPA